MKKIILLLSMILAIHAVGQKITTYDHVITYSERFSGTRASYHNIIVHFGLDSTICSYNASTHHADFFGNPADPSDHFVYDPRLQFFTADSVTFYTLYTTSLPVLEPLWTTDKPSYMPTASAVSAFKPISYTPTLSVSGSSISAGGNSVPLPASNTYSAGPGIVKNGAEPAAGFSADWTTVMAVSRANDSIAKLKAAIAAKANAALQLTFNGITQDLSANRTWSISVPSYSAGPGIAINSGTISNTSPDTWAAVSSNYQTAAAADVKYFLKPTGTTSQVILGNGTYTNYPTVPAQYNPAQGTGISISGAYPNQTIANTGVVSFNGRSGAAVLTGTDVNTALGYAPISAITSTMIVSALGYTPLSNTVTIPPATTITAGSNVSVSGAAGSYTVSTSSSSASISGSTLTVGTSTVQLPTGITYTAGAGISITSGSVIANTAPNVTQSITATAGNSNTITLSNGGGSVVIKGPKTYSGTTDASGNFTVTFATSYSVAPVVLPTLPNQTDKAMLPIVSSVTTTGFTINVFTRPAITTLPIIGSVVGLLGSTTSAAPSISVDVIVIEK